MRNLIIRTFFFIFLLPCLFECYNSKRQASSNQITVSVLPLKFFAEKIAGNDFHISVLVPPGSSAENFDPTPRDLVDISKSSMYITTGNFGFEKTLTDKLLTQNAEIKMIDVSKGMQLITNKNHLHNGKICGSGVDPHIWLSPKMAKLMAKNVLDGVSLMYPQYTSTFNKNYQRLIANIDSMDASIQKSLLPYKNKKFIIYHPALAYFARDYGLSQVSMEVEGKEPTTQNLTKLVDLAKKENIHTIFIQKEFDINMAKSFAEEINAKIVEINALSPDWFENMDAITKSLIKSFN
jgi:zinc transport system substrate-binding protein